MLHFGWTFRTMIVLAALSPLACTAPARQDEPVEQTLAAADEAQRDAIWAAAENTLRDNGFEIDTIDQRAGYIATKPVTSQQFFEPWRHDVATWYDFFEASLRTVRRRARVDISYDGDTRNLTLEVTVRREYFATPERQFDNSVAAFRMFGSELPSEQTGRPVSQADDHWIDAGRDPAMEQYLLSRIVQQVEKCS